MQWQNWKVKSQSRLKSKKREQLSSERQVSSAIQQRGTADYTEVHVRFVCGTAQAFNLNGSKYSTLAGQPNTVQTKSYYVVHDICVAPLALKLPAFRTDSSSLEEATFLRYHGERSLAGDAALAAVARRFGAPYPALVALAGAALALIPGAPTLVLDPELALALFVAPVLVDAAFDGSGVPVSQSICTVP